MSQQPLVYAAYPASGPVPAAYSAQQPRTNDVRGSRKMNATVRPSLDYNGRKQSGGYQRENRYNYPSRNYDRGSRNYDRGDRDRRDQTKLWRKL